MKSLIGLLGLCAVLSLNVQGSGLRGPLSGYVFNDTTGQILPIQGIPGAAILGNPVNVPTPFQRAVISPLGFAVTISTTGEVAILSRLDSDEPLVTPLDTLAPNPDILTLSQNGSAVALFWKALGKVQLFSGLPAPPSGSKTLDVQYLSGEVAALAPDNSGSYVLAASADSEGHGGVYRIEDQRTWTSIVMVTPAIQPVAVTFVHGGRDALALDRGSNELIFLPEVLGSGGSRVIATFSDAPDPVDRLTASDATDYVLVGSSKNERLFVVALRDEYSTSTELLELPITNPLLTRLSAPHLYLLAGPSPGPVQILDVSRTPQSFFVPPAVAP
ncbi:MAG: hypothetical protein ABI811_06250 [Acidobacteriota bacterium]